MATLEGMTGQGDHCLQRSLESVSPEVSGVLCHLAVRDGGDQIRLSLWPHLSIQP